MTDTAPPAAGIDDCRHVEAEEASAVVAVLEADPLVAAPAAEMVATSGVVPGEARFLTVGGPSRSLLYMGTSVLPLRGGTQELRAFGRAVAAMGRGSMSVHGRRELVSSIWETLGLHWGAPRDHRATQVLMELSRPVDPHLPLPGIRPAGLGEFEDVLPVAAAMYREELGSDPFTPGAGVPFRRRVARSLARGRTWVGFDGDEIVFKADIAAMSPQVAQIQGVWVRPGRRSRGIGTGGTAAVCAAVQSLGLTPSLVVNESNTPAVRAYRGVGMTPVVPYATVLTY
ncbi:MAG TPA: GNAT family N-acetyltransferase [Candidatus Dietzia intestinipullorum]|nr:GNAT family N-acetyltransferase [Candidatus Dietzia intestinipullorum]